MRQRLMTTFYDRLKRYLDVGGAVLGLTIAAPMLILTAVLVRLDGGPVLFSQARAGRNGEEFKLLKLRTMVPGAHELESDLRKEHHAQGGYGVEASYADPRVTKIGAILRMLNLDEFPQLINVLKGEMSLVGPRPVPYAETFLYGDDRDKVLSVRPGLTGYWQVKRRLSTRYEERVAMDCYYVNHRSLLLDAYILLRTPLSMLTSDYNSNAKPLPPLPNEVLVSDRAWVSADRGRTAAIREEPADERRI